MFVSQLHKFPTVILIVELLKNITKIVVVCFAWVVAESLTCLLIMLENLHLLTNEQLFRQPKKPEKYEKRLRSLFPQINDVSQ
jgi:hypothetical protein